MRDFKNTAWRVLCFHLIYVKHSKLSAQAVRGKTKPLQCQGKTINTSTT